MSFSVKKSIHDQVKKSYAKENDENCKTTIDCSEGINPFGCSREVQRLIRNINEEMIICYPHELGIKDSILNFWGESIGVNKENIVLGNGSINLIYVLNKLFIEDGTKVLGYTPQFPEYETDVKMCGGVYKSVPLNSEERYKFNVQEIISRINDEYRIIYLDNPNNPTGQIIALDDIERIIQSAKKHKIYVIVDEAYGEYMHKDNSCINLINKYENIIVLRTFSKGWGLAGLRAGYMIVNDELLPYVKKITNPYMMTEVSRFIINEAMKDQEFLNRTREKTKELKNKFKGPWRNIKVSESSEYVPIMLLESTNNEINLKNEFGKLGIDVISGTAFTGVGKNTVRFRIPEEQYIENVIEVFEMIDQL